MKNIDISTKIAWAFVGTPYRWGGDDPMEGFDCSGLLVEILKSTGLIQRNEDYTAQGLYNKFKANEVEKPEEGCMIFWAGSNGKIIHVEYCIDSQHTIGASGGGSQTTSELSAIKHNAYIKVRPIRTGFSNIIKLFK